MSATRIVVFAKAPQPGRVKTRLIPALGAEGAAALATRMLARTLAAAAEAAPGGVELCASPAPGDPAWRAAAVPAGLRWSAQGESSMQPHAIPASIATNHSAGSRTPVALCEARTSCESRSPHNFGQSRVST